MCELGKIKEVELRKVWAHEANNFTPWLRKNIDLFSEALGMDIEIIESEGLVGTYYVDLVGKDLGTGHTIIIENQLEQTNHSHLGQLLTYAAGRGAKIIVWITRQFKEEHQQALDWLNDNTSEDISLFGVEIKAISIDESKPAPLFNIVSKPNEWQKTAGYSSKQVSSKGEAYRAFWSDFLFELKKKAPGLTKASKGLPQNWCHIGAGKTGYAIGAAFTYDSQFKVELYIDTGSKEVNEEAFDRLYEKKEEIEQQLGEQLSWEWLDSARATRVALYTNGSIDYDEKELANLRKWGIDNLIKFSKVFGREIINL